MAAEKIKTPFATPERSAKVLGVSQKRVARLVRWAREASADAGPGQMKRTRSNAKSSTRKVSVDKAG